MSTSNEIEEAIQLMQEMGITRKQAVKALSRYNYDVGRAADYIFSGNADTDSGSEHDAADGRAATPPTLMPTAEHSSASTWDKDPESPSFGSSKTTDTPNSATDSPEIKDQNDASTVVVQRTKEVELVKDYGKEKDSRVVEYDPALWSVVPASSSMIPTDTMTQPIGYSDVTDTTKKMMDRNSLTWWYDPYDPSERARKTGICVGLRPPPYDSAYVPVILQSLYHISAFQYAALKYRPVPVRWGSPRRFWCGEGEAVPGVLGTLEERVAPYVPSVSPENTDEEQIMVSHKDIQSSDLDGMWENDELNSSVSSYHTEMRVLPECIQALAELQRIFGFLRSSKRQYGDVRTFVRALNAIGQVRRPWDNSDLGVDDFFDLLFTCFSSAERFQESPSDTSLQSLFLLKAQDDYGYETDSHELYYLMLKFDDNARTFHDCLTPWVYESRNKYEDSVDDSSSINTESTASDSKCHLTTFEVLPPILIVTLADKNGYNKRNGSKYLADKTIYMDRYLYENRDEARRQYEQADQWRYEIRKAKAEISRLSLNNVHDCREQHAKKPVDKRELLLKTMEYFQSNNFGDVDEAMVESLQSVLSSVTEDITRRVDVLHEVKGNCQIKLNMLFDTPDMHKRPYDIRALLHSDGGNGPGHHWAYIWVEEENLPGDDVSCQEDNFPGGGVPSQHGQWFRFFDALVTPVTEAEVFGDPTSPFVVIYVDRSIKKFSASDLSAAVPPGLQEFVDEDNASFEDDIEYFGNVDKDESGDSDVRVSNGFRTDDDGSDTFHEADSCYTVGSNEVQLAGNSSASEEFGYVETLELHAEKYDFDDYRLIQDFENFLAKIKCSSAIELYNATYVVAEKDDTESAENRSRKDPELSQLWSEYDKLVSIARIVTKGLIDFTEERYNDAVMWFLEAKKEEASWKQHLAVDTLLLEDNPMLISIGFGNLASIFGKACVETLENAAYKKASDPAYCTRGLQEAITIAHIAQAIIGPDKIANDEVFNEMRERWLGFSEANGPRLQDGQVGLLDSLIMVFLESESNGNDIEMSPPEEALEPLPKTGPRLAPVYRQARLDAGWHLTKREGGIGK